jgi:hypothetical protein
MFWKNCDNQDENINELWLLKFTRILLKTFGLYYHKNEYFLYKFYFFLVTIINMLNVIRSFTVFTFFNGIPDTFNGYTITNIINSIWYLQSLLNHVTLFFIQSKINRLQSYMINYDTIVIKYLKNNKRIKKNICLVVYLTFLFTFIICISFWSFQII